MKQKNRSFLRMGGLFLVLILALTVVVAMAGASFTAVPDQAPLNAPQAATLPADSCSYDGLTNTRTCELWAVAGTVDLPGWAGMPIWGYTDTDPASGGTAQIPGPAIIANQGEFVEVILHNALGETTSMIFPGQAMMPDLVGIVDGADNSLSPYSFTASSPGSYLYEAGPLPNAQHQVAMGLYGALIVRPGVANQAYADAGTAFNDEALLVLSDIDPALNDGVNPPADFDMRDYNPRYWLINGKAYPETDEIPSAAGNQVLLRFVNAGIEQHSMGTLGVDQEIIATDGSPLDYSFRVASATIGSGQTSDRIVSMPNPAPAGGGTYALYDTSMLLHNNGAAGFGGMMTFITVTDGTPPVTGPTTNPVALAPDATDGDVDVMLSATISGPSAITAAEYFVDTTAGTGIAMSAADGAFDSSTEGVVATIAVADLASLSSGDHTFYVHGSDGTWGAFNFAVLHLDKVGPATTGINLAPNPSDGSVSVAISATGNDTGSGGSDISAAEFFIDDTNGTAVPLAVNVAAPIASLDGSIDATTMAGLADGTHTVFVHSMDSFGWWGPYETAELVVDQTGPTTSNVTADPNPNNGALPYSPTVFALRVDATISDGSSNIQWVEGFIDTVGADGSGFPLTPRDGLFDELVEDAYAYIPLSTINQLAEGTHPISIHGRDASGNWGAAVAGDLVIDKTDPTVSNVSASPNPTGAATSADLTATASDAASDITMAEWFDGVDPGPDNGTPMTVAINGTDWDLSATIDVSAWAPGDHTLWVRAQDEAGNWSDSSSTVLCVVKCNDIFADSFASGDTSAWSSTTGTVSVNPGAAMDGDGFGMASGITGGSTSFVTDGSPDGAETSYHARFLFNPNSANSSNNSPITLLDGQDTGNSSIFRVEYRRRNAQGGSYQVRGVVLTAGGEETTGWIDINNNSANAVEIAWESGALVDFSLYVHDGLQDTLTGLDTSAYQLDSVHLGPSGGSGLNGNASGTVYSDAFTSTRYTYVGP